MTLNSLQHSKQFSQYNFRMGFLIQHQVFLKILLECVYWERNGKVSQRTFNVFPTEAALSFTI